jgi:hypothetical protein
VAENDSNPHAPSESYPGPEPGSSGPPAAAPASPGAPSPRKRAADTAGDDQVYADSSVAMFGPRPQQPDEPDGARDTTEKRLAVENRERLDVPPAGQPHQPPSAAWAMADHEAQSDPQPDPRQVATPINRPARP